MTDAQGSGLVDLGRIVCDEALQVRAKGTNPRVVKGYASAMKAGKVFPPVRLLRAHDALLCVDGFHRVEAARLAGRRDIGAVILDGVPLAEAAWLAAEANLTHGLQLRPSELKEAFKRYVKAGKHRKRSGFKSYREIAAELGGLKAHTTISNWMYREFPGIAAAMGGKAPEAGGVGLGKADKPDLEAQARAALETAQGCIAGTTGAARARLRAQVAELLAQAQSEERKPLEPKPF